MSTEPERDIEKTLRDYARHRQAVGGTPPALHPAARRLLQDEVSRQKAGERRTGVLGLFMASWPGFILKGSVALAVLVLGAFILTPLWRGTLKQEPTLLAKNSLEEEKQRDAAKKELPPAQTAPSVATAAPTSIASRRQSNEAATNSFKDVAVTTPRPVERARSNPVTAPAPVFSVAPAVAPPTPMPIAANATKPAIVTDTFSQPVSRAETQAYDFEKLGPITQQFSRVTPTPNRAGRGGGGRGGGATNRQNLVLRDFRVEQNGGQIRVIDADGSIYTGTVTPSSNFAGEFAATAATAGARSIAPPPTTLDQQKAQATQSLADATALKTPATSLAATNAPVGAGAGSNAPRSDVQVAVGFYFRVSGTNLTLNQPVEFSGNFVANDQSLASRLAFDAGTPPAGGQGGLGGARATGAGGGGAGGAIGGVGFASAGVVDSLAQTNVTANSAGNLGPTITDNLAPSPLANFRLQGQAVIGTNRVGINAVPTKP